MGQQRQQRGGGNGRVDKDAIKGKVEQDRKNTAAVKALIEHTKNEFEKALPAHIKSERFLRIALTTFQRTPALLECQPASFVGALMEAAHLGLEVDGVLGHAYLVPYWDKNVGMKVCQLIPGYKGLIQLVYRSQLVQHFDAHVVREADAFEYNYGTTPNLFHRESLDAAQDAWEQNEDQSVGVKASYAVVYFRGGGSAFRVVPRRDILKARSHAKTDDIWRQHFDAMAVKTAIRRVVKLLPTSVEVERAVALEELHEAGVSQGMLQAARSWLPVAAQAALPQGQVAGPFTVAGMQTGDASGADQPEGEKVEAGTQQS